MWGEIFRQNCRQDVKILPLNQSSPYPKHIILFRALADFEKSPVIWMTSRLYLPILSH
jgi:hypothetical protein